MFLCILLVDYDRDTNTIRVDYLMWESYALPYFIFFFFFCFVSFSKKKIETCIYLCCEQQRYRHEYDQCTIDEIYCTVCLQKKVILEEDLVT